jgi:class III poly(R)-hydroxyalkanoic acid synthase PhaE subunit
MQSAFTSGNITSEGQTLYKEYFDKQMSILNNMQKSAAGMFGGNEGKPQEFFKEWFNQQAGYAKQMADFTQSLQSSFANFGKPAQDYMSTFGQSNTAFTNIYNSWLNTLNASYDALSKNMPGSFNKDIFSNFVQGNQVYAKMQEFFQPMANAMQKGQFNFDAFKNHFTADSYNNLAKQMFSNFYTDSSIKEVFNNAIAQLQQFFAGQQNLSKEYFAQMQSVRENFPQMFSTQNGAGMKEFFTQVQNIFGKTFEPLMKVVAPGKDKENAEALISLMDKMTEYTIKQAELQTLLSATAKKGIEKIAQQYAEKFSNPANLTQTPNSQEMFSEWVKVNEQFYTELFASENFSKIKGETLNLSNEVKKHFEKQFENSFRNFPIVFKSEVEELHKTIYELRKQVKEVLSQSKMSLQEAGGFDEEKKNRTKK